MSHDASMSDTSMPPRLGSRDCWTLSRFQVVDDLLTGLKLTSRVKEWHQPGGAAQRSRPQSKSGINLAALDKVLGR
jgi:hypothetical protein